MFGKSLALILASIGSASAQQTIADVLQNTSYYQSLVGALDTAGLLADLSGSGSLTLFAPTDTALAAVPTDYLTTLVTDPAYILHLQNLLAFHVDIEAALQASDLSDGQQLLMANNEYLTLSIGSGGVSLSSEYGASANVQVPDEAIVSNGVIHQLDAALFPKFIFTDLFNATGTLFQSVLTTAGLGDALTTGDYTVLMPSDTALMAVSPDVLANMTLLTQILQYHIIDQVLPPSELQNGQYTTASGDSLTATVSADGKTVTFDGNSVSNLTLASNGIVYTIDAVLIPGQGSPSAMMTTAPTVAPNAAPAAGGSSNLAEVVGGASDLTTLTLALQTAGLVDAVAKIASATVFAPVDSAFANIDQALVSQLLQPEWIAHVQNLLTLHVVTPDVLYAANLTNGATVTALSGENLTIDIGSNGSVFVNGPDGTGGVVVEADVPASNGVVHKIDSVLLPTWVSNDLLGIAAQIPEIATLVGLITSTGLDQTLATGLYTLLAPSDDAFAAFLQTNQNLTDPANQDKLIQALTYHVIPRLLPTALLKNSTVETVEGSNILTSVVPGVQVMFNDATAVLVDIPANNGLIYVIDQVLAIEDITPAPASSPTVSQPPTVSQTQTPASSPVASSPVASSATSSPTANDAVSQGVRRDMWTALVLAAGLMMTAVL